MRQSTLMEKKHPMLCQMRTERTLAQSSLDVSSRFALANLRQILVSRRARSGHALAADGRRCFQPQ